MKLVSFSKNGQEGFGIFSQSGIYPVLEKFKKEFPNLRAVIGSQKIENFENVCLRIWLHISVITIL